MEEETIKDKLDKLIAKQEELVEKKQMKRFRLPFWRTRMTRKNRLKNFTIVMKIDDNRNVDFIKTQIDEGATFMDKTPRAATADYVLNYKGKPLIIQPTWSALPFYPGEDKDDAAKEQRLSAGYKVILNKMEKEAVAAKRGGFGLIGWIILGAVIIGAIYYMSKGGKLF